MKKQVLFAAVVMLAVTQVMAQEIEFKDLYQFSDVDCGTTITGIEAKAETGHHFLNWSDDVTTAKHDDIIVGKSGANVELIAYFAIDTLNLSVDAINGDITEVVSTNEKYVNFTTEYTAGKAVYGNELSLTAKADECYKIKNWTVSIGGGEATVIPDSEGKLSIDYTMPAGHGSSVAINAIFEITKFNVTIKSADAQGKVAAKEAE